jgi:hypothetical protein
MREISCSQRTASNSLSSVSGLLDVLFARACSVSFCFSIAVVAKRKELLNHLCEYLAEPAKHRLLM